MDRRDEAKENAIPVGRRASQRARLILKGRIETLEGVQPAEILSLSRTGAMAKVKEVPRLNSSGILICGAIDVFFTVVWAEGDRCGLHFEEPITEQEVIQAREVSDHDPEREQAKRVLDAKAWATGNRQDG